MGAVLADGGTEAQGGGGSGRGLSSLSHPWRAAEQPWGLTWMQCHLTGLLPVPRNQSQSHQGSHRLALWHSVGRTKNQPVSQTSPVSLLCAQSLPLSVPG